MRISTTGLAGQLFLSVAAMLAVAVPAFGQPPQTQPDDSPVFLFPIVKEGKWGYMDRAGQVVIQPQYDGAWDFYEGLACVGVGLNRGYIDRTGAMVIPPRFGWAGRFSCGLAPVYGHRDGKPIGGRASDIWGDDVQMYRPPGTFFYVDRNNKPVGEGSSPADYYEGRACRRNVCVGSDGQPIVHDAEELGRFSEGLAAARKGNKWGYLDLDMKWVVEPKYDMAEAFGDGLGAMAISETPLPEGARARDRKGLKMKWGFVDRSSKVVIQPQFADADSFSEHLAAVRIDSAAGAAGATGQPAPGRWGYIDKTGAVVVKPAYDYAWRFSEGLGRVLVGEKHGYVNKEGKLVIEPKFDVAWEFAKGLARVGVGEKEGYIDHDGKYVWEPTE